MQEQICQAVSFFFGLINETDFLGLLLQFLIPLQQLLNKTASSSVTFLFSIFSFHSSSH